MAPQVDLARSLGLGAGEANRQRPADKIGVDGELNGSARLPGKKNIAPVIGEIRRAAFRRAAFPYLDFEHSLDRTAVVAQFDFERKGAPELKGAMKADARFDENFRLRRRRGDKATEKNSSEQAQPGRLPIWKITKFMRRVSATREPA